MKHLVFASLIFFSSFATATEALKTMSCSGGNMLGVASLNFEPQTNTLLSVINMSTQIRYDLAYLSLRTNGHAGVVAMTYNLDPTGLYLMTFPTSLKIGKNKLIGTFARRQKVRSADPYTMTVPVVPAVPIAVFHCEIEIVQVLGGRPGRGIL